MNMSKTEALKIARKAIYAAPRGKGWAVIGPWWDNQPDGPITERPANDYWDARAKRTRWVARMALGLMGWDEADAEGETYDQEGSVEKMVNRALAIKARREARVAS